MAGLHCTPARNFLLNEIATMLPRAIHGKEWYDYFHVSISSVLPGFVYLSFPLKILT